MNRNFRKKRNLEFVPSRSLIPQPTFDNSLLSSTKNPEINTPVYTGVNRRLSIIPTPNRLKVNKESSESVNNIEELKSDQKLISKSAHREREDMNPENGQDEKIVIHKVKEVGDFLMRKEMGEKLSENLHESMDNMTTGHEDTVEEHELINNDQNKTANVTERKNHLVSHSNCIQENDNDQEQRDDNEDNFDTFILRNFVPFTGKQDVIKWLDETENKFNQFGIPRDLRFESISLLVEGDAKRQYIRNRKSISSYDDFYEFLWLQYETIDVKNVQSHSYQPDNQNSSKNFSAIANNTTKDDKRNVTKVADQTRGTQQLKDSNTNVKVDFGATSIIGEIPCERPTMNISSVFPNAFDSTLNELRKAIVSDLIKKPKTFKGGKEDVTKWVEEIEHLLDIAHIPDPSRLNLISYSLRGDALSWYKINKSTFTSWSKFVCDIKKAFTSSFQEELAFKTLESYTQGENQSIRNFFNEVLKLCNEADAEMSESTKLKNLLNKTKPSLQLEVRKRKPTSTSEFLEFAKEAEELYQLSNISIDRSSNSSSIVSKEQQSSVPPVTPPANNSYFVRNTPTNSSSVPFRSNYNNYNNRYDNFNSQNSRYYSAPFASNTPRPPQYSRNQNSYGGQRYQQNRYDSPSNIYNRTGNNNYSQRYQNNFTRNNKSPPHAVNSLVLTDNTDNANEEEESFSDKINEVCTQSEQECEARTHF